MNPGVRSAVSRQTWQTYFPKMFVVGAGSLTQPIPLGTPARNLGRWIYLDKNTVQAEIHMAFSYWSPVGAGGPYIVELPVPAKRPSNAGSGPVAIGHGYYLKALADPQPQVPIVTTLADKRFVGTGGLSDADSYMQCYVPVGGMSWGTGTWSANAKSVTITHNAGYTPDASDINFQLTQTAVSPLYDNYPLQIQSVGSTTFTVATSDNNMDTVLMGQTVAGLTAVADRFGALYGATIVMSSAGTGSGGQSVMPCAGTLSNLYVEIDTADATQSRTFTVYKNGADTGITTTLAATVTSGNDTTHTVSFAAGDTVSIHTTGSGAGPNTNTGGMRWTLKATTAACVSMLLANANGNLSTGATTYVPVQGFNSDATAGNAESVMPTAGTIKNAYMVISGSPGGVGKDYTATLYQNGSPTSLVVTCSNTTTSNSDTNAAHAVTVTAGDRFYWSVVPTGTPTARQLNISVEFDPTTNGESVHMFSSGVNMLNSAARYHDLTGGGTSAWTATESARQMLTQAATWKKLYVYAPTATGAAKTWQFQLSKNTTAGNPTVTIDNSSTTGSDTTNTITTAAADKLSMKVTPSGTPTTSQSQYGIVSLSTSNTLSTGTTTYGWRVNMTPNSSMGDQMSLVAPYSPMQQTILKGWFIHITYEVQQKV